MTVSRTVGCRRNFLIMGSGSEGTVEIETDAVTVVEAGSGIFAEVPILGPADEVEEDGREEPDAVENGAVMYHQILINS